MDPIHSALVCAYNSIAVSLVVLLSTEIHMHHFLLYDGTYSSFNMESEHTDGVAIFGVVGYLTKHNQSAHRD